MAVYITASGTAAWTCTGYCNGFPIGEVGGPGGVGNLGQLTFLVPNGQTYYVFNTGNVLTWYEQLIG